MRLNLRKLNESAVENASLTLSKLFKKKLSLETSRVWATNVEKLEPCISSILHPEEMIFGIRLLITGDIKGTFFLAIPQKDAFVLINLLLGRKQSSTGKLTKLGKSALKEFGNIICGQYFTILVNMLGIRIVEHVPNFKYDMFGSIASDIIVDFSGHVNNQALVVIFNLISKPVEPVRVYFIIFFQPLSTSLLLK